MKELTYEDWQKNPMPRMMWVWDDNAEKEKVKRMVLFLTERNPSNPVIALTSDNITVANYKHCAELEKQRRMTNKELSWWLSEKPHRERKFAGAPYIYTYYVYREKEQDEKVPDDIIIREDGGEWLEPLVEVEE